MISDNSILEFQRIESVLIHIKVLENVLYVLKLKMNLLSMIQVARKGYSLNLIHTLGSLRRDLPLWLKGL